MKLKEVVITGATRTAIGKFGGALQNIPVADLGAHVIKNALERSNLAPSEVDEVLMGCTLQTAQGQNPARQAAIRAGIPVSVPALTLNNLCGSGLRCINMAASLIISGHADVVVAGGMENMSAAPYALSKARFGYRLGDAELIDTMLKDSLVDAFEHYHMGVTAENIAQKYHISRSEMDTFALESQIKCQQALESGQFIDEISPLLVKNKHGDVLFATDEYPRANCHYGDLSSLKPAFTEMGSVTAGNASGINDGAAALVLMSAEKARELGIKPLARWIDGVSAGVEPSIMGIGPVNSTLKLLNKTGISLDSIDLIEANEAFAAQAIAVEHLLNLDASKINVNGGAIALGHPVGASGARILVTLLYALKHRNLSRGLATLCVGGGMGVSTLIEISK